MIADQPGQPRGAEWLRRRSLWALVVCLLATSAAARPRQEGGAESTKPKPPRIQLSASVQAGFAPLTIHFTARLKNAAPDDRAFCHAGTALTLRLGGNEYQNLIAEDPACVHAEEEVHVSLNYSRTFTLDRPGLYEFVFIIHTNDGRRLLSNAVPVRVLSSPAER